MACAAVRNIRVEKAHTLGTIQIKLTCVEITLAQLENVFAHDKAESAHLRKVRHWLERCWRSVGQGTGRKLSAEVMRRADRESAVVDDSRKAVIGKMATVDSWAAYLIALDALIHDVVCLWEGGKTACWRYLDQTWETVARRFLAACEDPDKAEENGTEIYLLIVDGNGWAA